MKKLGVRWMPGLPFLNGERVSHAFSRPGEAAAMAAAASESGVITGVPGMALVLVLAQDPNIAIEQQKGQSGRNSLFKKERTCELTQFDK